MSEVGTGMSVENYERPIKIAEGIFWVGSFNPQDELHCNPFMILGEGKAVIIDPGSRPDFAGVMMKIMQAGVHPDQIVGLVLQHYDPDLCGSVPNFLDLCGNPELRIYSKASNNLFIRHYLDRSRHGFFRDIKETGMELSLGSRKLKFIKTPYTHSAGSFVTWDETTRTLFTSDLFGSLRKTWSLRLDLSEQCFTCADFAACPNHRDYCPFPDIISFHRHVMPCCKALRMAMKRVEALSPAIIAPQHGSVIDKPREAAFLTRYLRDIEGVGIDGIPED